MTELEKPARKPRSEKVRYITATVKTIDLRT